jgi:hypothetical protein
MDQTPIIDATAKATVNGNPIARAMPGISVGMPPSTGDGFADGLVDGSAADGLFGAVSCEAACAETGMTRLCLAPITKTKASISANIRNHPRGGAACMESDIPECVMS